jgi:16S rRNA (cytosine1402-N4)-methyltransferase
MGIAVTEAKERHVPVMVQEVMECLDLHPAMTVVDATVGHGGHAREILQRIGREGTLIACDWDEGVLQQARENLKDLPGTKIFLHRDYRDLPEWLKEHYPEGVDAILMDLGVCLEHLQDPERGFSFLVDAPLDMRFNPQQHETASAWLGRVSEPELVRVLKEYGGERYAGPIARAILQRRRRGELKRTTDLVSAVLEAVPPHRRERRIHPATRTFQAIRIAVNRELEGLKEAVENLARCLKARGRMVVLSYHSGEDREVKLAFRNLMRTGLFSLLNRTPLTPSREEVERNPRSRSAKLRALLRGEV